MSDKQTPEPQGQDEPQFCKTCESWRLSVCNGLPTNCGRDDCPNPPWPEQRRAAQGEPPIQVWPWRIAPEASVREKLLKMAREGTRLCDWVPLDGSPACPQRWENPSDWCDPCFNRALLTALLPESPALEAQVLVDKHNAALEQVVRQKDAPRLIEPFVRLSDHQEALKQKDAEIEKVEAAWREQTQGNVDNRKRIDAVLGEANRHARGLHGVDGAVTFALETLKQKDEQIARLEAERDHWKQQATDAHYSTLASPERPAAGAVGTCATCRHGKDDRHEGAVYCDNPESPIRSVTRPRSVCWGCVLHEAKP